MICHLGTHSQSKNRCIYWMASTLVAFAGCIGPQDDTIMVSGKVSLDGKPIATGDIEFSSKDKSGFRRGTLITNGEYRTVPMQGLVPGEFTVRIFSVPGGAKPAAGSLPGDEDGLVSARDMIPSKYNMRSTLSINVTQDGEHEFNFELTSK